MAIADRTGLLRVCTLSELERDHVRVVHGGAVPIAVFAHDGRIFAVDNRCPHMGFPLHKGTVKDGILTCHWHEARFDLSSGCTFDLWADDVPAYDVQVEDGEVYVSPTPRILANEAYHHARLRKGMESNVGLLQAKALLGLLTCGSEAEVIARESAQFAASGLDQWTEGLVRLACVVNIEPHLKEDTRYHALYYAVRKIASERADTPPRRGIEPLAATHAFGPLKRWLRQWVLTRHRDAAERTLLTAVICDEFPDADLGDLVFGVASDRPYADRGHLLDACNKAWELATALGPEWRARLFPLLARGLVNARGGDESTEWHHPVDLVGLLRVVEAKLPKILAGQRRDDWNAEDLATTLLGDDPARIVDSLTGALEAGAPPARLAQYVAYAAAIRLARFSLSNEVGDWFNPQHTFIFANAVHEAIRRSPTPDVVRALFHAALAVYLDRYLNVPPARLPGEHDDLESLPEAPEALLEDLLDLLDHYGEADAAARIVARYIRLGHPLNSLIDTMAHATLREDLDFHTLQVLEAAVRQAALWDGKQQIEHIFVGVVRNLAAHCPTQRSALQTANIALRLHRGDRLFEAVNPNEAVPGWKS